MIHKETDILIIGGGIAGCIAAISLIATHRVILIDKLETPKERIGESLAPATQRIFKALQLQDILEAQQEQLYIPNLGMQSYWGSDQVHIVDHLRNPDGLSKSLDRKAFEQFLRTTAQEKGVECIWPSKLLRSSYTTDKWEVIAQLSEQKEIAIKSKFVIDATGRQSHFARSLGIKRLVIDKLISCWITLPDTETNKMSSIIATENGWWYSAVIPNNKRVIAFQTDSDLIDKATFKSLDAFYAFAKADTHIFSMIENHRDLIDFHGTVSANSTRLEQVTGKQWVAIGDAAISFDPLSSQGMFNAMANAIQLKELILASTIVNAPNQNKAIEFQNVYTQQINAVWEHYLSHKNTFYKAERRWSHSPFWERRQTMS